MMSEAWKDLKNQPESDRVWPPRPSVPPAGVSLDDWQNPVWQLAHRIRSAEQLAEWIQPTDEEVRAIEDLSAHFRFVITPYYASLMDPLDPECPLRRQVVPKPIELEDAAGLSDPLDEVAHSPVKNVIRVYPDRIAFCVNNECGLYCRTACASEWWATRVKPCASVSLKRPSTGSPKRLRSAMSC